VGDEAEFCVVEGVFWVDDDARLVSDWDVVETSVELLGAGEIGKVEVGFIVEVVECECVESDHQNSLDMA